MSAFSLRAIPYFFFSLFVSSLFFTRTLAQTTDTTVHWDFVSDDTLLFYSLWQGDTGHFSIDSFGLRQIMSSSGSSNIVLEQPLDSIGEFNISGKIEFNPSSQNYCEIILQATDTLYPPLSGTVLRIGKEDDRIQLIAISENQEDILAQTPEGFLNSNSNLWRVSWKSSEPMICILDEDTFISTPFELPNSESSILSICSRYTSTRADKFWYSNLHLSGKEIIDSIPPSIDSIAVGYYPEATLWFSEPIVPSSFTITGVEQIHWISPSKATISFSPIDVNRNSAESIFIGNFQDLNGNFSNDTILSLYWKEYSPGVLAITEVFCDPTPSIGLGDLPFIEISSLHPTDTLYLSGLWIILNEQDTLALPTSILPPKKSILIYDTLVSGNMPPTLSAQVDFLPLSMRLSENHLSLWSPSFQLLDKFSYHKDRFSSPYKAAGGWSQERNTTFPWYSSPSITRESIDSDGGTPGTYEFEDAFIAPPQQTYNVKYIAYDSITHAMIYHLPLELGVLCSKEEITKQLDNFSTITNYEWLTEHALFIQWQESPSSAEHSYKYIEMVAEYPVKHTGFTLRFPFFRPGNVSGIRITEVLFEETEECPEFIEFWNTRESVIEWSQVVTQINENTPQSQESQHLFLLPNQLLVWTKDTTLLFDRFGKDEEVLYSQENFPSLPNTECSIGLYTKGLERITHVQVSRDWHTNLSGTSKGKSLEIIEISDAGNHSTDWITPLEDIYPLRASPGEWQPTEILQESTTGTLTPNGDGIHDVWTFKTSLDQSSLVSAELYSLSGHLLNTWWNKEELQGSISVTWKGEDHFGLPLPTGTYVFVFQNWDTPRVRRIPISIIRD